MFTEEKKNSQIFQDSNHLLPKSELEVSNIIKEAYKKKFPFDIHGANTKKFIGYNVQAAKSLDLSSINGIIEYLPEELYIKVKPGTLMEDVESALEKNNQELSFEPTDFGYINNGISNKGTVGGCVACNFAGSRRFKSGSVRDFVLGFRGVNGKGDIIKSGGTVVKNVTGYDLSKLVSGSFGTLVALTEITLKISAKKPSQNTIVIYENDPKVISDLFQKVLSSSNEISGAVFIPDEPQNKKFDLNKSKAFKFNDLDQEGSFFALRVEGDKNSIKENLEKFMQIDASTRRNLELTQTLSGSRKGSLLDVIDRTVTGPGARLLEKRLSGPSTCLNIINPRLDAIESYTSNNALRLEIQNTLRQTSDIERAFSRLSLDRGGPRDFIAIRNSLRKGQELSLGIIDINSDLINNAKEYLTLSLIHI